MNSTPLVYKKEAGGNYTTHADLKKAAREGDGTAAYRLAKIFEETNEHKKAKKWANKGAELGHTESMYCLSQLCFKSNFDRTMYWLQEGANKHHEKCMITLGDYFRRGVVVPEDDDNTLILQSNQALARSWYQKASDEGNINAKIRLGNMDFKIREYGNALGWYRNAEEFGSGEAMARIGDHYRKGLGVEKNLDLARNYYNRAITAGYHDGKLGLEALDNKVKHLARGVFDFFNESSE